MADETRVYEGQDLLLFVEGTAVCHSTTHSLEVTLDLRDRVSKDTGKWKGKKPNLLGWKASCDALACYNGYNYHELYAMMIAREPVTVKLAGHAAIDDNDTWTPEASGDTYYEGSAYITGLPLSAPNNEDATFSCSFEGDGELEQKTVA